MTQSTDAAVLRDAETLYIFLSACPKAKKADFLLVLGSHDLRVPEYAAALYRAGLAPLLVCTGGYGKMTQGCFTKTEAVLFAERCVVCGVPPEAIRIEDQATNTGENFSLSKKLISGVKTGLAVCKPYMARRALATGTKQWAELRWGVSVPPLSFAQYMEGEDMCAEIELMVGDLQRLRVYAEKGFQSPTEVPDALWAAWRRLVDKGFDRFVIPE